MKTKLFELQNQADRESERINALSYAIYLLQKEHDNAKDMVDNVPTNKYFNEWKEHEEKTKNQLETLESLYEEIIHEHTQTANQIGEILEQLEKKLNDCESAYQEQAIELTIDDLKEYEMNEEEFSQTACDYYRETLKGLDLKSIYKGFELYGDETLLDGIARDIYKMLTLPTKYYDTFYGHKVSEYGLKNGRLDYATLSKCFDCVLCNNITELDEGLYDNIISGDLETFEDSEGNELTREEAEEREEQGEEINRNWVDIFQFFIVSDNAKYLLEEANEIVFYSEKLDCYIWGITHYGTSWDYVLTSIKLEERKGE